MVMKLIKAQRVVIARGWDLLKIQLDADKHNRWLEEISDSRNGKNR